MILFELSTWYHLNLGRVNAQCMYLFMDNIEQLISLIIQYSFKKRKEEVR